jgi:hypothetical protein
MVVTSFGYALSLGFSPFKRTRQKSNATSRVHCPNEYKLDWDKVLRLNPLEPSPFTPLLSFNAYFHPKRHSEILISPGTNRFRSLFDIRLRCRAKLVAIAVRAGVLIIWSASPNESRIFVLQEPRSLRGSNPAPEGESLIRVGLHSCMGELRPQRKTRTSQETSVLRQPFQRFSFQLVLSNSPATRHAPLVLGPNHPTRWIYGAGRMTRRQKSFWPVAGSVMVMIWLIASSELVTPFTATRLVAGLKR